MATRFKDVEFDRFAVFMRLARLATLRKRYRDFKFADKILRRFGKFARQIYESSGSYRDASLILRIRRILFSRNTTEIRRIADDAC